MVRESGDHSSLVEQTGCLSEACLPVSPDRMRAKRGLQKDVLVVSRGLQLQG